MRALFAGSFDPVTNGHLDLIERAVRLVDSLVVAVAINPEKHPIFAETERIALLREVCSPWPTVEIRSFTGLTVDAVRQVNADVIIRGVRNSSDFSHELQMAHTNRALTGIETLLLPADPRLSFISSSLVREVARFHGDVSPFVPAVVADRLRRVFSR